MATKPAMMGAKRILNGLFVGELGGIEGDEQSQTTNEGEQVRGGGSLMLWKMIG